MAWKARAEDRGASGPSFAARGLMDKWIVVMIAACVGLASCDDCPGPVPQCPAAELDFTVTTSDGQSLSGVEATLSGAPFDCRPTPTGAYCSRLGAAPGLLHVTAPGFQPVDVDATVTTTSAPHCGCPGATLTPSTVSLGPSDGGVD